MPMGLIVPYIPGQNFFKNYSSNQLKILSMTYFVYKSDQGLCRIPYFDDGLSKSEALKNDTGCLQLRSGWSL